MEEEKDKTERQGQISRREFLKDAGLIVSGATVGSVAILSACGGGEETTKTVTTSIGGTGSTVTVTQPGATATITVTAPVQTVDSRTEFDVNGNKYKVEIEPCGL
jgi:diaminopimelate epimerase